MRVNPRSSALSFVLRLSLAGLMCSATAGAFADTSYNVIKLRGAKVALFDKPNGAKVGEVTKDQFKGLWRVTGGPKEGHLQVQVDGKQVWVKTFAVETDRPVTASAECGATVAIAEPQSAATRGLGEECKK